MKEPETKWISWKGTLAALKGFSSTGAGMFVQLQAGAFAFPGQVSEFPNSLCCAGKQRPLIHELVKITEELMAEV